MSDPVAILNPTPVKPIVALGVAIMGRHGAGPYKDEYYPPQQVLTHEPCAACGKILFRSRRAAESSRKRLERDHRSHARGGEPMRVYSCPEGNGWHLSHAESQARRTGATPSVIRRATCFALIRQAS